MPKNTNRVSRPEKSNPNRVARERKITSLSATGKRRDRFFIDPRLIVDEEGLNERVDFGDPSLKDQIEQEGVQVDLTVKVEDGKVKLIHGYRRMRFVRELIAEKKWKHGDVPVVPERKGATEIDRLLGQITLNEGKPYTILEQGRVFERLQSSGLNKTDIAHKTGKSRTHVANGLALAGAPPAIITAIEQKKIAESLVIDLMHEAKGEVDGDNGDMLSTALAEKLVEKVSAAIGAAGESGKTHATRKHTGTKRKRVPRVNAGGNGSGANAAAASPVAAGMSPAPVAAEDEETLEKIVEIMRNEKRISTSLVQRRLRLSYSRADHLLSILMQRGIIGPAIEGTQDRPILNLGQPATILPPPVQTVAAEHESDPTSTVGGVAASIVDSPLARLHRFILEIDRHECEDACYDTIIAVRDFIEGKRTPEDLKNFIRK